MGGLLIPDGVGNPKPCHSPLLGVARDVNILGKETPEGIGKRLAEKAIELEE